MNIFVLDYDSVKAAQMQCDKHVVKVPLEKVQVLCTAFPKGKAPYKLTHFNPPCSIWCRESREKRTITSLSNMALLCVMNIHIAMEKITNLEKLVCGVKRI